MKAKLKRIIPVCLVVVFFVFALVMEHLPISNALTINYIPTPNVTFTKEADNSFLLTGMNDTMVYNFESENYSGEWYAGVDNLRVTGECNVYIKFKTGTTNVQILPLRNNYAINFSWKGAVDRSIVLSSEETYIDWGDGSVERLYANSPTVVSHTYPDTNSYTVRIADNEVTYLDCTDKGLTSLEVKNNPKLKELHCSNNLISNLSLSKNTVLEELYCNNNFLSTLDLSNSTSLARVSTVQDKELRLLVLESQFKDNIKKVTAGVEDIAENVAIYVHENNASITMSTLRVPTVPEVRSVKNDDGKTYRLEGIDATMEYNTSDAASNNWTTWETGALQNIKFNKTYYIRTKAVDGTNTASLAQTLKVDVVKMVKTLHEDGSETITIDGMTEEMEYSTDINATDWPDWTLEDTNLADIDESITYYVRLKEDPYTIQQFDIIVVERAEAPEVTAGFDENGIGYLIGMDTTMEYNTVNYNCSDEEWIRYNSSIEELKNITATTTFYIRVAKSDDGTVPSSKILKLTVNPSQRADVTIGEVSDGVYKIDGMTTNMQYTTTPTDENSWVDWVEGALEQITASESYYVRVKGETYITALNVYVITLYENEDRSYNILGVTENMEYAVNEKANWVAYTAGSLNNISVDSTYYIRVAEKGEIPAGQIVEVPVVIRPAGPKILYINNGDGTYSLTGIDTTMEYNTESANLETGWIKCIPENFINLSVSTTYYIRVAAANGKPAGRVLVLPITESDVPNAPNVSASQDEVTKLVRIDGMTKYMEYNIISADYKGEWTKYSDKEPLEGISKSIIYYIRYSADGDTPASAVTKLEILFGKVVKFDANGGDGYMDLQEFEDGIAQNLATNIFTKEDCIFKGWATEPEGEVKYLDNASYTIPEDETKVTLYAIWQEIVQVNEDTSGANEPNLAEGLTPVNWTGKEWKVTTKENWKYNYNMLGTSINTKVEGNGDGAWANAQTEDGSLYVWIPRYTYKIVSGEHKDAESWNSENYVAATDIKGEIKILFSNGTDDSEGLNQGYKKHSAFTFGEDELEGIWVAKYEASRSDATSESAGTDSEEYNIPTSKPGVVSWREEDIVDMYNYAYNLDRTLDSHLMRNAEWGAVAYLTNAIGKIPYINNSSSYITGNAGESQDAVVSSGVSNDWNSVNGVKASTTHNVYGIYDLSGGSAEYVSAYYSAEIGSLEILPVYNDALHRASIYRNRDTKYVDYYKSEPYGSNEYAGDAMYEISGGSAYVLAESDSFAWDGDYSKAPYRQLQGAGSSIFVRGGSYKDEASAGIFGFNSSYNGSASEEIGFRTVLSPNEKITYTVTFCYEVNDGYPFYAQTFTKDIPENLEENTNYKNKYTFKGWATTLGGEAEYLDGQSYIATSDAKLYEVWEKDPEIYTITFNKNDGTDTTTTQEFTEGVAQALALNTFEKEGCVFKGWAIEENGAVVYGDGADYTATESTTLYAVWQEDTATTYTVIASAGDGGIITPGGTTIVNKGENVTFTIMPDDGYEVLDVLVNGESVGAVTSYIMSNITEDKTISATFKAVEKNAIEMVWSTSKDDYIRTIYVNSVGNATIYWGDGKYDEISSGENIALSHEYSKIDNFTVTITEDVITYFNAYNENISKLDVTGNIALEVLSCSDNNLSSLDLSKNTALKELDCSKNDLTSLNISINKLLVKLDCSSNSLTSLDVSENKSLTSLSCSSNSLTSLDVSENKSLKSLSCSSNGLTSLAVSENTLLTSLSCSNNSLTSLDVSKNTSLIDLYCSSNGLTSLDVTNNIYLACLQCNNNGLTSLDVSENTALKILDCSNNSLTSLDISNNTALTQLTCSDNSLTSLDISNNLELIAVYCQQDTLNLLVMHSDQNVTPNRSNNTYIIRINTVGNGTIKYTGGLTFEIIPDESYEVYELIIGGKQKNPVTSYTFSDLTKDTTITAKFTDFYKVIITADENGQTNPSGEIILRLEESKEIIITPDEGYEVDSIKVNGENVGNSTSYTLSNLTSDTTVRVSFKLKTYEIIYMADEGTNVPTSQIKTHGSDILLTEDKPEREGYNFVAWNTEQDGSGTSYLPGATYSENLVLTLYAQWELKKYTVNYNLNYEGFVQTITPSEKTHGQDLVLSDVIPTRENYKFLGWGITSIATEVAYNAGGTFSKDQDTTLYAIWVEENVPTYKVTIIAGENGKAEPDGEIYLKDGESKEITFIPDEGYEVADVVVNGTSYGVSSVYNISSRNANEVVEVSFKLKTYTVEYDVNGGAEIIEAQVKTHGKDLTLSDVIPTNPGHIFIGWARENNATDYEYVTGDTFTLNEDTTLFAVWKKLYTITLDIGDNGTVAPNGDIKVKEGDNKTFVVTPNKGYEIDKIFVDDVEISTNSEFTIENVTSDIEIKVTFKEKPYFAKIEYTGYKNQPVEIVLQTSEPTTIDWGDGVIEDIPASPTDRTLTHTYKDDGEYTVIFGNDVITKLKISNPGDTNKIKELDISKLENIEELDCSNNELSELDITNNKKLKKLNCSFNNLPKLDTSNNKVLIDLICEENELESLDLSNNSDLENLDCDNNELETLDLSKNSKLKRLKCSQDSLRTIYLTKEQAENMLVTDTPEDLDNTIYKDLLTNILLPEPIVTVVHNGNESYRLEGINETMEYNTTSADYEGKWTRYTLGSLTNITTTTTYYIRIAKTETTPMSAVAVVHVSPNSFIIRVIGGKNGEISPSGIVIVRKGQSQTFYITPNSGYTIDDVIVDGKSVGRVKLYTFRNVTEAHTIKAEFRKLYSGGSGGGGYSGGGISLPYEIVFNKWKNKFTDVSKDDWYYEVVEFVIERKYFSGMTENTFGADIPMTREMFMMALYNMDGKPITYGANNYYDVPSGHWSEAAIVWGNAKGMISGFPDGSFKPQDPITREQVAIIMKKYAEYKGQYTYDWAELTNFKDNATISEWAYDGLRWAVAKGIIKGNPYGYVLPQKSATRAEVAAMFMNYKKAY